MFRRRHRSMQAAGARRQRPLAFMHQPSLCLVKTSLFQIIRRQINLTIVWSHDNMAILLRKTSIFTISQIKLLLNEKLTLQKQMRFNK